MKAKTQYSTAVGVFEDRAHAQQAVNELRRLGFHENEIGVVAREGEDIAGATEVGSKGSHAATGAAAGAATGAGMGALWGLGIAAGILPAIGPAIAGGTLAAILASAATGAAVAGVAGALIGLGIPEDEAHYYEDEFKAGRIIVTVKSDTRLDEARAVLSRFGGYDMHTRGTARTSTTSSAATLGTAHTAATTSSTTAGTARTATGTRATATPMAETGQQKVQLREEELHVQKQPVQTGEVHVRKEVHTEHRTLDVPVMKEEVVIERRPVTGHQVSGQGIREGEEIRIPVREEQVHVVKEPVVKEEITVGKREIHETEHVAGEVRKEEVHVEKTGKADVKQKGQRK